MLLGRYWDDMSAKKNNNRFEKRLMEHLDRLDPDMLRGNLQGLIQEKGFLHPQGACYSLFTTVLSI